MGGVWGEFYLTGKISGDVPDTRQLIIAPATGAHVVQPRRWIAVIQGAIFDPNSGASAFL